MPTFDDFARGFLVTYAVWVLVPTSLVLVFAINELPVLLALQETLAFGMLTMAGGLFFAVPLFMLASLMFNALRWSEATVSVAGVTSVLWGVTSLGSTLLFPSMFPVTLAVAFVVSSISGAVFWCSAVGDTWSVSFRKEKEEECP